MTLDGSVYEANAEYYDLITRERLADFDGVLIDFAADVDAAGPPVIDVGAGTGTLTARLADLIAPCEVFAIEPSRSLRALLASRVAANEQRSRQITILPATLAACRGDLPDVIGGAIAFGVLPHLGPDERASFLALLSSRLSETGAALVEVMPPWTAEPVPRSRFAAETMGRHRIECFAQAEPAGDDQLCWTMMYRRIGQDGQTVHEAVAESPCWVVDPETFAEEAARAGLRVAWKRPDLALLSR